MKHFIKNEYSRAGFTLAEILLAMLVFSIAITTILALLARSIETVDDIVLRDEAMRLSSAVEQELSNAPFAAVYNQFATSGQVFMHAFHYRVSNDDQRAPVVDRTITDVLILPFVTGVNNSVPDRFAAREGRYYRVRLSVSPTNPLGTNLPPSHLDYESAALVLFAEFFPLGSPSVTGVPANAREVYAYNFAVRR